MAAGVGSSPYVMNCNVTINTVDVAIGCRIAAAIRESNPDGLPGVQVLALPHEGTVEIACNVESMKRSQLATAGEDWPTFSVAGQLYSHIPANLIKARVAELAAREKVRVNDMAVVGFTPRECRGLGELALALDIPEFWKEQRQIRM